MKTENNTTTLTERTQGVWAYRQKRGNNIYEYVISNEYKNIVTLGEDADISDNPEEIKANAAFICKAVNNYDSLLNALKNLLNVLPDSSDEVWEDAEQARQIEDYTLRAQEAIKKAEQ